MKPTLIIATGHGLHAYWLFKELWVFNDTDEKKHAMVLSKDFQKTIHDIYLDHGYKLDNTASLAQVLRIPGTYNRKKDPPDEVKILKSNYEKERRYTLEDFTTANKKCTKQAKPKELKTIRRTSFDRNTFPESNVDEILQSCRWIRHCKEDSKQLTEPEWFFMLTQIAFCKDAVFWACKMSEDYEGYTEQETLSKLRRIKETHKQPVSCAYIRENFSGYCNGCNQRSKTPFALGIDKSTSALEKVGFIYDDDGDLKSINENIFTRYILTRFNFLYTPGGRFYQYQDGVWHYVERNQLARQLRDLVHEFAPDFWSKSLEDKYLEALKREAPYEESLDSNRNYINLKNGMLNLETYELEPHHPNFRSSVQIPIEFNEKAICPNFDKFLDDIFQGDKDLIKVVSEMLGYCLTANTSAQKAFFLYGKGANGKSLLALIMLYLCGKQNVSAIPLADLESSFNRHELVDKLLNLATENEISSAGLNTAPFKAIVSGDSIQVEKKYEQSFLYQPVCKLVFSLNNLPYSKDRSWGFHRRILVIPFNKTFREDDPNTKNYDELKDLLLSELDGILINALGGLKRLRDQKYRFSYSKAVEESINDYKQILNPYIEFVHEFIEQGENSDKIENEVVRKVFQRWCAANGHERLAKSSHNKMLSEIRDAMRDARLDFDAGKNCKSGGKRYIKRIRLKCNNCPENNDDDF